MRNYTGTPLPAMHAQHVIVAIIEVDRSMIQSVTTCQIEDPKSLLSHHTHHWKSFYHPYVQKRGTHWPYAHCAASPFIAKTLCCTPSSSIARANGHYWLTGPPVAEALNSSPKYMPRVAHLKCSSLAWVQGVKHTWTTSTFESCSFTISQSPDS